MKDVIFTGVAVAAALVMVPAMSHHSTNLWYDMTKVETIEGEYVGQRWISPHSVLQVNVPGANGQKELWSMETHSASVLARADWKPKQFTGTMELFQTDHHIGVISKSGNYRMVRMGKVDTSALTPTHNSISVGRWEGDRLNVLGAAEYAATFGASPP